MSKITKSDILSMCNIINHTLLDNDPELKKEEWFNNFNQEFDEFYEELCGESLYDYQIYFYGGNEIFNFLNKKINNVLKKIDKNIMISQFINGLFDDVKLKAIKIIFKPLVIKMDSNDNEKFSEEFLKISTKNWIIDMVSIFSSIYGYITESDEVFIEWLKIMLNEYKSDIESYITNILVKKSLTLYKTNLGELHSFYDYMNKLFLNEKESNYLLFCIGNLIVNSHSQYQFKLKEENIEVELNAIAELLYKTNDPKLNQNPILLISEGAKILSNILKEINTTDLSEEMIDEFINKKIIYDISNNNRIKISIIPKWFVLKVFNFYIGYAWKKFENKNVNTMLRKFLDEIHNKTMQQMESIITKYTIRNTASDYHGKYFKLVYGDIFFDKILEQIDSGFYNTDKHKRNKEEVIKELNPFYQNEFSKGVKDLAKRYNLKLNKKIGDPLDISVLPWCLYQLFISTSIF